MDEQGDSGEGACRHGCVLIVRRLSMAGGKPVTRLMTIDFVL